MLYAGCYQRLKELFKLQHCVKAALTASVNDRDSADVRVDGWCVRYPGCKHGTCNLPNECICDEGWGGHFCSEDVYVNIADLNYCTRHRPCKNGAMCLNTGHGQYTCECSDGYSGVNCEIETRDCSAQPCLNGGTCLEKGGNYTCLCPRGYSGRQCQLKATSCLDNPCRNGAVCKDLSDGFVCQCPTGWTGHSCEIRVNPCNGDVCFNGACGYDFHLLLIIDLFISLLSKYFTSISHLLSSNFPRNNLTSDFCIRTH
ncbi:unnamed protein product [Anisakis simplex]|uniref:Crumbs cell polarity complex component 2b n=1 Tax=Anisakis simplex TaxID=6269 RepID=A0A0M3KFB5_ANISI|nr:unnamed protein product [Anisakis simplex]